MEDVTPGEVSEKTYTKTQLIEAAARDRRDREEGPTIKDCSDEGPARSLVSRTRSTLTGDFAPLLAVLLGSSARSRSCFSSLRTPAE